MEKQSVGRVLAAVALTAAAVSAAAVPAAAGQDSVPQCAAGDVSVDRLAEGHSPSPDTSRMFNLVLKGNAGADCVLSGPLLDVRFYDFDGRPVDIPFSSGTVPPPLGIVHMTEGSNAYVYIKAPRTGTGPVHPVARMDFSAPTAPASPMSARWPSYVFGPLAASSVMQGVS
ncbi:hypothetical protein [Lentzea sp. NPDC060358]|uniref:hypothetical protein n=1 Tax=Lentzea sp. NPDC060358 TaxID=3347103 RepID=UPI00364C1E4A